MTPGKLRVTSCWPQIRQFFEKVNNNMFISTIWILSQNFEIIWNYPDSFESRLEILISSGNIWNVLKVSGMFLNCPGRFETKVLNCPEIMLSLACIWSGAPSPLCDLCQSAWFEPKFMLMAARIEGSWVQQPIQDYHYHCKRFIVSQNEF